MRLKRHFIFIFLVCILLFCTNIYCQIADSPDERVADIPVNYTESKVGEYTLPDPLKLADGTPVTDTKTWYEKARPRILKLFHENQFGRSPEQPIDMTFDVFDKGTPAFNNTSIRKQVTIYFTKDKNDHYMDLLIYIPTNAKGPVPLLLSLGFTPNNTAVNDPGIKPGRIWDARQKKRIPASTRGGFGFGRLNVQRYIDRGFCVATFNYSDVDLDSLNSVTYGIRGLYLKPGQTAPAPDEWGAISAWAWGMSRAMDYFETDNDIDEKRVAITGVSRLGKTVLWAGARDERFALVIDSSSGAGGAALNRRNYGETIAHLTHPTRYPYQFCANYAKYANNVDEFPIDSHMLIALIAPRPVLLQTGNTDKWADPYGVFLAAVAASPVYELLGEQGLGTDKLPAPGEPILHTIGFLMHNGGHGSIPSDVDVYLKFMEMHLKSDK